MVDALTAMEHLRGQSFVRPDALAAVGFCFGGGMVWNLVTAGVAIRAAAPFYGQDNKGAVMQTRIGLALAALIAAAALTSPHVAPAAQAAPASGTGQDSSTLDDQIDLVVTVVSASTSTDECGSGISK